MSLRERLDEDLKAALRAKDATRLGVIRGIKAAVLAQETQSRRTVLDDDGIIAVIVREVKERREVLPQFEAAGRQDLVEKAKAEIAVLESYLPEPFSPAELSALIAEAIAATGAAGPKDHGKVMGWLAPKIRGRADGRQVAERVREQLSH
ncbi:MAG: GatB/YqeY domain-containing protein [Firmicutes bacterium]|nr:GatB/YqeY domain-containing protein [Alicyclobacillaceae bacterium]MCL6496940.1 GatB/YqeY domain-containing protein [Bacillota bacterium]